MARHRVHSDESILDATRDLLARGGTDAATTSAICAASGAPVGSLYHRFGSRSRLFAEVWLRTAQRFQAGFTAAIETEGAAIERALAAAVWSVEFAERHPEEAHLLLLGNRKDLLAETDLPADTRRSLASLNEPIAELLSQLAADLFGSTTPDDLELVTIAVVDVPYAIVRRHLRHGASLGVHRDLIANVVRTMLTSPNENAG